LLVAGCISGLSLRSEPALLQAADKGNVAVVRGLLAKGADVHVRDERGRTALMYAARNGDAASVQVLLVNGAEANARDWLGWTALMYAAEHGDEATVRVLLAGGAHVNAKSTTGWTALMSAALEGRTAAVQALLSGGAETDVKDQNEQTALILAVRKGYLAVVQALLGGGADVQVKDREGKTALTIAETEGFSNIAQLLKQAASRGQTTEKTPNNAGTMPPSRKGAPPPTSPAATPPAQTVPPTPAVPPAPVRAAEMPSESLAINFGRYYALVIGNNAYTNLHPLRTAVNDANAIADMLQTLYGFNVTLLLDVTREEIITKLDTLRMMLTDQDNLLIYYAGHGVLDPGEERGYWLPVDARRDSRVHWIANTTITDALKAMAAKHVLVVADSCYSGTLVRGIDVIQPPVTTERDKYLARIVQKRSRTVLTAGGLEPVSDTGGGNHSVFAKAFMRALQDNVDVLDAQQLFSTIRRPVVLNAAQTPEYSDIRYAGHEGGDFLFVRRSSPPAPEPSPSVSITPAVPPPLAP
jgi:ankyrin repeat protein